MRHCHEIFQYCDIVILLFNAFISIYDIFKYNTPYADQGHKTLMGR